MSTLASFPKRRDLLFLSAAAGALSLLPASLRAAGSESVRPFNINVPEEALVDLRRRLAATRWPDKETVDDDSQGRTYNAAKLSEDTELVRDAFQRQGYFKAVVQDLAATLRVLLRLPPVPDSA